MAQNFYLLEYGGFNSQGLIGNGYTDAGAIRNTGSSTSNGNTSYGTTANATTVMSYRGIENIYGNAEHMLDGLNIKANYDPWIADHGFVSDTFAAPYSNGATPLLGTTGWPSDIKTSTTYDYGFLPSAGSGGYGYGDLYDAYYCNTGNCIAIHGRITGLEAGMFGWNLSYASNSPTTGIGSRLMYIG